LSSGLEILSSGLEILTLKSFVLRKKKTCSNISAGKTNILGVGPINVLINELIYEKKKILSCAL